MPVVLITGCAQGIGRGIAIRMAKDGYAVALNDIPSKKDDLAALASELGVSTVVVAGDVSKEEDVKEMVSKTVSELGGLDVLVANAAACSFAPLLSMTSEDWDRQMNVNGKGTFLCYKYAAEQMVKQNRGGRIIGASSYGGKQGYPYVSAYCASKWAIRGFTQSVAKELAAHNITVNAYAPGGVTTEMSMVIAQMQGHKDVDTWMDQIKQRDLVPQRAGQPEDLASLVAYLASDGASYITGQTISVNGGMFCD